VIRAAFLAAAALLSVASGGPFDRQYDSYGRLLHRVVAGARVDYGRLLGDRGDLDAVVSSFDAPTAEQLSAWPEREQLAFWINAYNLFTLRAIVDHYPIHGSWFSRSPRNSIRQIDGVWTTLTWRAGGREVTLDDVEHRILRPTFKEPRVHFALNCASVGCPPLAVEPYVAARLDAQLDAAARRYLAGPTGLQRTGNRLRVSSILKWYGDDFIERYAAAGPATGTPRDRAVLGVVARFGPPAEAELARSGRARVEFLDYDWSLIDVDRSARQQPPQ
jgi:hypothetical protein